jgi:modulator of FtsH protease HflK
MPWSNQSGGGGPWGQRGGPGGPWGSGPQGGGSGGPPDLEDILRRSQDRIKDFIPGGGSMGGKGAAALVLGAVAIWLLTGFYIVGPNQVGIETIFGKYIGSKGEGLRYNFPYPIGQVIKPNVTAQNTIPIGYRPGGPQGRGRDVLEESLMLTGDENIVDIDSTVFWRVKPGGVGDYLFNIQNPEGTVKAVAESAMREVVGHSNIQPLLTGARQVTETAVHELMQKTLDFYGSGITIQQVQLQKVDNPAQVIDAARDVQAARADAERAQNEAQAYANRVVPEARGRVAQITQAAEAYREQTVAEATGQTSRFLQILDQYQKAPDVTRQRMYLETMERLFNGTDKVIIDAGQNNGVVPYLPLPQLGQPRAPQPQQQPQGGSR